jgi:hypothetical protein
METQLLRALLLLGSVLLSHQRIEDTQVQILHSWRFPDWIYPSESAKQNAIQQGLFIPQNCVILDSDYYFSPVTSVKRIFVTTPAFRTGIPATLSEVTRERSGDTVLLSPFPNGEAQNTCEGLTCVYRIHIDKCGLLWVVDTGRVETFDNPRRVCRPKLVIYDLNNNDNILARYEFPDGTINDRSNLITIVTESYQNDCSDSVAYIADVNGYGLVVFDLARQYSWRVEYNFFYPFPHMGTMTVNGQTFDLMDGVFGLALSPPTDPHRKLYFHALASIRESWVSTSFLKNTTVNTNPIYVRQEFHISDDVREGQTSLEVMTDDGILIYGVLPKSAISCWNSATPFKKENLHMIYEDPENLQFISGMKLKGNQLLITTSRLQNYINGITNTNDIKYRMILIEDVNKLLQGTPCRKGGFNKPAPPPPYGGGGHHPTFKPTPPRTTKKPSGGYPPEIGSSSGGHYRKLI